MNKQESSGLRRLLRRSTESAAKTGATLNVSNDAEAYGVSIKPGAITPGAYYWQAVRVHHLQPEENGGNHHIYLDVFDPSLPGGASPYGARVNGARLRITWDGGEQIVSIDKPANEPGANFPMWKWQVCTVQVLGLPGQELISDEVIGIHTGHPDEGPGNTLFHHSFALTFVKVKAANQVSTDSVIHGVIQRAAGRKAILRKNGLIVASQTLEAAEAFRFVSLGAGQYSVGVEGTSFQSAAVTVDGRNSVQLALTLTLSESVIAGRVTQGAGRTLKLLRGASEVKKQTVASDETFRFAGLSEGSYRVAIADTSVVSAAISVNGVDSATVELAAPASNRALSHYVLFGPATHPTTRANLLLAHEFLFTYKLAFGFSAREAGQAGMVTIIGDTTAISAAVEQQLRAGGVPVQRIRGAAEDVARLLTERITRKNPFNA